MHKMMVTIDLIAVICKFVPKHSGKWRQHSLYVWSKLFVVKNKLSSGYYVDRYHFGSGMEIMSLIWL